jgi:hypothetical protein
MLAPASPASIADEFVTDQLALCDYALKANLAAWSGIRAALDDDRDPRRAPDSGGGRVPALQ